MRTLELPITIRTARIDELPSTQDNTDWIEESKTAKIVEGYILHKNETSELPFTFFAEINVDNSKLWEVFKALLISFEEEISFIFGHIDNEPLYSKYGDKFDILNQIEKFQTELTQDGFLEFGIIYHDEKKLKEVFIKKPKYIQYWGIEQNEFLKIMNSFSIYEIEDMKFIDEFPLVTETLRIHRDNVIETSEVINQLAEIFVDARANY
jgi:hypothetical protein